MNRHFDVSKPSSDTSKDEQSCFSPLQFGSYVSSTDFQVDAWPAYPPRQLSSLLLKPCPTHTSSSDLCPLGKLGQFWVRALLLKSWKLFKAKLELATTVGNPEKNTTEPQVTNATKPMQGPDAGRADVTHGPRTKVFPSGCGALTFSSWSPWQSAQTSQD